ncbi:unnamed protein product [Adineta steineri]|uniref:Uncharacterized protein n=1 Tax=Adineta steineri TaxID=433720 RepID=A0A819QJK6_9BILA|nr:unnamed protein product [Adineta steineri]
MKLDNLNNLSKLKLADIPKFTKCPCELCDDGCFEKCGNEHYPGCKNRLEPRSKLSLAARCPLSHYQGTFLAPTENHRRELCPPVPDNEIPTSFINVPMSTINTQKEHYPPPPAGIKKPKPVSPAKQSDKYIVSGGNHPMETQTHYTTEYIEKPVGSVVHRTAKDVVKGTQVNITDPSAAISSKTTSRAHFKQWQPVPVQSYTEIPALAGHVVFPNANRTFDTTSGRTFVQYSNISQAKPFLRPEVNENLRTTGTMDLHTNYRQDYATPKLSATRSAPIKTTATSHEEKIYTRRPMNGISQTTHDFRPHSYQRRTPLIDMEPFQSQINIGDLFSSATKDSQYRVDYPGYDAKHHHRPPPAGPQNRVYAIPTEKMDSLTVTQRDFQPLDVTALPRLRGQPTKTNLSVKDQTGPMESVTMSRYHYRPYKPETTRRLYGDPHPNVYIPLKDKFEGTTTTGDAFQGRLGRAAEPCIPEVRTVGNKGKHDHNTNYRMDYHSHGLSLCASKAFTIAQNNETNPTPISTK